LLGHFDIDCITSKSAFPALVSKDFHILCHFLQRFSRFFFPKRADDAIPDQRTNICSRRMKLFLLLFLSFGWSVTAIQLRFSILDPNINIAMNRLNKGFLI
jgi:hypothetical protein